MHQLYRFFAVYCSLYAPSVTGFAHGIDINVAPPSRRSLKIMWERTYSSQERVQQLGSVGDQALVVLIDRVHGKNGVLADERVSVLLVLFSSELRIL